MSYDEFLTRANHTAPILTAGIHWNAALDPTMQRLSMRISGFWHACAPAGARCAYPSGLPEHGPRVCALGAYVA